MIPALKWLVDIDFYIRFLKNMKPVLITENLVRVGVGEDQVTKMVFQKSHVEIPENFYLLNKIGVRSHLKVSSFMMRTGDLSEI